MHHFGQVTLSPRLILHHSACSLRHFDFDCSMRSVAVDALLLAFALTSSAHPPAPAPSRELLLEIVNKARLLIWLLTQRY